MKQKQQRVTAVLPLLEDQDHAAFARGNFGASCESPSLKGRETQDVDARTCKCVVLYVYSASNHTDSFNLRY